jgi:hypothetical protein
VISALAIDFWPDHEQLAWLVVPEKCRSPARNGGGDENVLDLLPLDAARTNRPVKDAKFGRVLAVTHHCESRFFNPKANLPSAVSNQLKIF